MRATSLSSIYYFAWLGVRSIAMSMPVSVCMSVCRLAYPTNHISKFY